MGNDTGDGDNDRSGLIFTPLRETLLDAGFGGSNFYLHPLHKTPATYIPLWHLLEAEPESNYKVTEVLT